MDDIIIKVREGMDHGWVVFFVHGKFSRTHKNPLKQVGKVSLYLARGAKKLCFSDWRALRCRKGKRDS